MKKVILLSTLLLASFLHAKTVMLDMHSEQNISVIDGCTGDGVLSILSISQFDRDVQVIEVQTGIYDVSSKDKYRNWNMDNSNDSFKKEGRWTILSNNYEVLFSPDEDYTKSPSQIHFSITGDSSCSDVNDTFYLKYFDGNHFNDLNLPAGAILDEIEYIQSSSETIEVLSNDINAKNAKGIVFVQAFYNSETRKYSCNRDSIYAKTLDGNTTSEAEGRIFATRSDIVEKVRLIDTNVSVDTLGLTAAQLDKYYSTLSKYNQKPGIWSVNPDLSINFIEKNRDVSSIRLYLNSERDVSTIGYMSYDESGEFGKCNVIVAHPKGMRTQKIYLDEHKKETVTINLLDLNESVQKQAHAAVIKESLKFYPSNEKVLTMPDEGTWTIDENNLLVFNPLDTFDFLHKNPSEVKIKYDVNENGIVDYLNYPSVKLFYPIRANYDSLNIDVTSNENINPLSNDTGDLNVDTLRLVSLDRYILERDGKFINDGIEETISKSDNESALSVTISSDGKDAYSSEGHWKVVNDRIIFYRDSEFKGKPSRIGYSIKDVHSKTSFGLLDFKLGSGDVTFKPFYDINKDGVQNSNERNAKNIIINYTNQATDESFKGETEVDTGILEKELEIGTYDFYVEMNQELYKNIENESYGEFIIMNQSNTDIKIPLKRKSGIVEIKICLDTNENLTCDAEDEFLKNTLFKVDNNESFIKLENGETSIIDVKTSSIGEFKEEFNNGVHIISYKGIEKNITVSDSDILLNILVPKGYTEDTEEDSLINSESSVPSLNIIGLILLSLGFSIIVRRSL